MDGTNAIEGAKQLHKWHQDDRLAHAYLCVAENTQSLKEFARLAAEVLLCERPQNGLACGECSSCMQIRSGNHPNLDWLVPDGASMKIQQMRAAIQSDTLKSFSGVLHLFVMEDVHKLTIEAANSILKWVEEPSAGRLFLLLTPAPSSLLATLRSRVQLLRMMDDTLINSGNIQENEVFSFDKEEKWTELEELVREFGETAYSGARSGWHLVSEKWVKWSFNAIQTVAFADMLIRYLHHQAETATDSSTIHRYAELTMGAFQVRRQLQSHVNAQLAWETYLINASRRDEGLGR